MNVNITHRTQSGSHLTAKQKGHSQKIKGKGRSGKGKTKHINSDHNAKRHCCTPVTNNDEPQNIIDAGSDTNAHTDATHINPQNNYQLLALPNTVSRESDTDSGLGSDQENNTRDSMPGTTDFRTKSISSCQLDNNKEGMQIYSDRSNYKIYNTFGQEPSHQLSNRNIRSETTCNLLQQSEPEFSGNVRIEDNSERSPSEAQLHKDISERSPSEAQLHKDISERSPSEEQLHKDISERSPSEAHLHKDILERSPSEEQLHKDISEHSPSEEQLHKDISERSPSEAQLHKNISEHSPSEAQLHKDISEHSPSEAQLHKDISEHSPSEAQIHKDISEYSPSEAQLHKDSSGSQMTESCAYEDPLSYRNCTAFPLDGCFLIFAPLINSDTNMSTEPPTTLYLDDCPCEANFHGSVINSLNKSLHCRGDCKYLQMSDDFNDEYSRTNSESKLEDRPEVCFSRLKQKPVLTTWLKFNDVAIKAAAEAAAINRTLPFLTYSFYQVPESKRMAWEFWRLSSFAHLTDLEVSPIRLAQSGFYYDKASDNIVCFSCGVRKRVWKKGEKPSLMHLDISPDCAHANFKDKSNIPITENNYTLLPSTNNDKSSVSDCTDNIELATGNGKDHPWSNQTHSERNDDVVNAEFNGSGHVGWSHATSASVNTSFQESILEKKDSRPKSNVVVQTLLVPPLPRSQGEAPQHHHHASNKGDNSAPCATKDATTKHVDSCRQDATTVDQRASQESFVPVDGYLHVPVQQQQNQDVGGSLDSTGPRSASVAATDTSSAVSEVYVPNLDISRVASRTHASIKTRLASYIGWPRHSEQNPNELANAGFYYLGVGDSVRCFYCGVTVHNWRSHDDPWVVHVLFRFSCEYMIGVKGQLFITQIQIKGTQGLRSAHTTSPNSTNNESTNGSMETIATQSASNDGVGEIAQAGNGATDHYNSTGNSAITNNRIGEQLTNPHLDNTRIPDVKFSTAGIVGQTFHSGMASGNQNVSRATVQANQAALTCQNGFHGSSNHQALIVSPVTVQYGNIINTTRIGGAANGSSSTSSQLQVDGNETNSGEHPETGVMTTRSTTDHHSNSAVLERRHSTEVIPPPSTLASPNADSGQNRLDRVLEANRRLKEQRTCKICRHGLVDTIFLPCGHLCTCSQCASTRRHCCLCNEPIQGTAHVYLE